MKLKPVLAAAVVGGIIGFGAAQTTRPETPDVVQWRELPLKFPLVGNFDDVKQWRFGRLVEAGDAAGSDIFLRIRMADGNIVRVVGPRGPLAELAFRSEWVRSPDKQFPGAPDYAQRMIAFDYDENFRIIALASLEPINRNRNRLWRALT